MHKAHLPRQVWECAKHALVAIKYKPLDIVTSGPDIFYGLGVVSGSFWTYLLGIKEAAAIGFECDKQPLFLRVVGRVNMDKATATLYCGLPPSLWDFCKATLYGGRANATHFCNIGYCHVVLRV